MSKSLRTTKQCATAIEELATHDRALAKIQANLDEAIAQSKKHAEDLAQPLEHRRAQLVAEIESFCDKNRAELTEGGTRKFGVLTTGKVGWRTGQPKLEIDPKREEKIIDQLLAKKSTQHLVNVKRSLDQRAIVKDDALIKSIRGLKKLPPEEKFWVEPVAVELAGTSAETS